MRYQRDNVRYVSSKHKRQRTYVNGMHQLHTHPWRILGHLYILAKAIPADSTRDTLSRPRRLLQ